MGSGFQTREACSGSAPVQIRSRLLHFFRMKFHFQEQNHWELFMWMPIRWSRSSSVRSCSGSRPAGTVCLSPIRVSGDHLRQTVRLGQSQQPTKLAPDPFRTGAKPGCGRASSCPDPEGARTTGPERIGGGVAPNRTVCQVLSRWQFS